MRSERFAPYSIKGGVKDFQNQLKPYSLIWGKRNRLPPKIFWEAGQTVSGLMRITKLTRRGWLLAQQGGALPQADAAVAFVVVHQDSNVLRPRSERACRRTTAVPFLSELERSHLIH